MRKLNKKDLDEGLALYDEGRSRPASAWFSAEARADLASTWYPVIEPLPALGVRVRVRWHVDGVEHGRGHRRAATYVVEAARMREPMAEEGWVWVAMTNYRRYADGTIERQTKARAVVLDSDRGQVPTAWQPLVSGSWRAPLPDPLEVAALLPPAMGDPIAAPPQPADGRAPWWLDATEITYSQPGSITWREAEGRVCRAIWSTAWVQKDGPRFKTFGDILARMADERDLEARKEIQATSRRNVPWQPTGRDDDDFLTAMGWFAALVRVSGWRKARVLVDRSSHRPVPWRRIAQRLVSARTGNIGVDEKEARNVYRQAVNMIERIANDPQAYPNEALEEIKRRNRSKP